MPRLSKSATCFSAGLPATRFRHAAPHSHGPLITMLAHRAALKRLEATCFKHCREQRAALFQLCEEQKAMLRRQCREEIAIEVKHREEQKPINLKHSQEMEAMVLKQLQEEEQSYQAKIKTKVTNKEFCRARQRKIHSMWQIRGALENLVEESMGSGIIPRVEDTQEGLNLLARRHQFVTVLQEEVQARGLHIDRVMACLHELHWAVSTPLQFYGGPIRIARDIISSERYRAGLVAFFKAQSNWPDPIEWFEETSCKTVERRT